MKHHILLAALLAALTAHPDTGQAQTTAQRGTGVSPVESMAGTAMPRSGVSPVDSMAGTAMPRSGVSPVGTQRGTGVSPVDSMAGTAMPRSGTPPVALTAEQPQYLREEAAARAELLVIQRMERSLLKTKYQPIIEESYFKKYIPELATLARLSPEAANWATWYYHCALTRKVAPLKPVPDVEPIQELIQKYAHSAYIAHYASEAEVAKITPKEYQRNQRGLAPWNSVSLRSLHIATQRINTPEAWDAFRTKQLGRAVLDQDFVNWINDKSKTLETPAAIALVEREVRVLSLTPKTDRRDTVLQGYLTSLALLKQLTK